MAPVFPIYSIYQLWRVVGVMPATTKTDDEAACLQPIQDFFVELSENVVAAPVTLF